MFCTFWLANRATPACHFSTSKRQKVAREPRFLNIWLANLFRATAACQLLRKVARARKFFYFAPQHRAIFPHRNFKNGSEPEVFCAFRLDNCFALQPTSQLQKLARKCHVVFWAFWLENALRATAACHSAAQLPPHRRFTEPTFRTSGTTATNHWRNTAIRDFPNIWRVCIFSLLACWSSSDLTSLVCFSTVHIVGS